MGIGYPNVGVLLAFIGALAANTIAYITPSLCYISLCKGQKYYYWAWFMLSFGLVGMVLGITGEIGLLATGG